MKRPLLPFGVVLVLLFISCSSENEPVLEPIQEEPNQSPSIVNQTFEVSENSLNGTSIGTIVANDAENDKLFYSLTVESIDAFIIDRDTGELKVLDSKLLDYETSEILTVEVVVTDGNSQANATITVNVLDVDDGGLSNLQKEFIDEFRYVTYNLSPTSFGASLSEKWTTTLKLYLEGNISSDYRSEVQDALDEFNMLFSDGFEIVLTASLEEANVHAIKGELVAVRDVFPALYAAASQGNFSGYALYSGDGNFNITSGQIWLNNNTGIPLFKHELGHIIGLGHANNDYCGSNLTEKSIMCSNPGAEFTTIDKGILSGLYHPDIEVGKTFSEISPILEILLLTGSIQL